MSDHEINLYAEVQILLEQKARLVQGLEEYAIPHLKRLGCDTTHLENLVDNNA